MKFPQLSREKEQNLSSKTLQIIAGIKENEKRAIAIKRKKKKKEEKKASERRSAIALR